MRDPKPLSLEGYRFSDLQRMRLVRDRSDLHRKQYSAENPFPKPYKIGAGGRQTWWPRDEVEAWLRRAMEASRAETPKPYTGKRRGRPPKAKQHEQPSSATIEAGE